MGPSSSGGPSRLGSGVLAAVVMAVVAMMIVPLPTWLLDVLITLNLAVSVTLLLAAVYARDALSIATFPTLLVLTTLYRLGLNVSTTRLILLRANAGQVVRAFGWFVVSGDYIVGAAVFLILTIVQYVVISRGAERVAEVAARFTLDAMPGKQLAIDGDLRAGAIDAEEAKRRRASLSREAQLYGALDGAMRFVKGDAIAGILILIISLVGGLIVGTLRDGRGVADAAKLYTLLTIGDGLVSQLPALLISTAAGLVVTRVASDDAAPDGASLGTDMMRQLLGRPVTLFLVAGLLVVLSLLPGLPLGPFLAVALPFAIGGYVSFRRPSALANGLPFVPAPSPTVEVAVSTALAAGIPDLDRLLQQTVRRVVEDLGLPLPTVQHVVDGALPPRGYQVRMRGVPLLEGVAPDGKLLADASPARLRAVGIAVSDGEAGGDGANVGVHPHSGAPAAWVPISYAHTLEAAGIAVLDAAHCVAAALNGALRRFAPELLGLDEAQRLLDGLTRTHPALVREVQKRVDMATLADLLRRLLAEGVPIGDLRDVFEAVAAQRDVERDPALLVERVRSTLRRQISHRLAPNKQLAAFLLHPMVEEAVRDALRVTQKGQTLALEPALAEDILNAVKRALDERSGSTPVIVTSPELRRHVRLLLEGDLPQLAVVTYQELSPDVQVEPIGTIAVAAL